MEKEYVVRVYDSRTGTTLVVPYSKTALQTQIRDAVWSGVIASQKIEGEPVSKDACPPSIESVPEALLKT